MASALWMRVSAPLASSTRNCGSDAARCWARATANEAAGEGPGCQAALLDAVPSQTDWDDLALCHSHPVSLVGRLRADSIALGSLRPRATGVRVDAALDRDP
jgi:hypothetical protein